MLSYENTDRPASWAQEKTTFYQGIGKHTKKTFAILENEYGAVGIDADRLRAEEGQEPCQHLGNDMAASAALPKEIFPVRSSIANTIEPEYLVIEPTGVGMFGNVMKI